MSIPRPVSPLPMPSPTSVVVPRPLQLVDGNLPSNALNSPMGASPRASQYGQSTPPQSARSFKPNSRRQSSISYFPSDHVSSNDVRSPTRTKSGLKRSNSLGIRTDVDEVVLKAKGNRRSLVVLDNSKELVSPGPAVERGPLTLIEKHADLLQFIAQKEAKCLELRSQLATHEAELTQLKRKWERIISRGMDRAYSSSSSSPLLSYPTPVSAAPVSSIIPTASTALKEGVRMLAVGLELSSTDDLSSSRASTSPTPMFPVSTGLAGASRASMTASPAMKKVRARHSATQSMSSVSTTTSSSTAASSSTVKTQRLSQSSASSMATSLSLEDVTEEDSLKRVVFSQEPEESTTQVEISPMRSPESVSLRRRSREGKPSVSQTGSPQVKEANDSREGKRKPRPSSVGLPPTSYIPGLSPLPTPMSSWMGSVGKKLTEMQRGETFTKSQKRASLLLSDVSQSIFSALSTPSTPLPVPSPRVSSTPGLSPVPSPGGISLLEDDNSDDNGKNLGDVLIPTPSPLPSPSPVRSNIDDDEDWNW